MSAAYPSLFCALFAGPCRFRRAFAQGRLALLLPSFPLVRQSLHVPHFASDAALGLDSVTPTVVSSHTYTDRRVWSDDCAHPL